MLEQVHKATFINELVKRELCDSGTDLCEWRTLWILPGGSGIICYYA